MGLHLSFKPDDDNGELKFKLPIPDKYAKIAATGMQMFKVVKEGIDKIKEELHKDGGT